MKNHAKGELKKASAELEALVWKVTGAGMAVHRALGPGLLESVYRRAMLVELRAQGIECKPHVRVEIHYRGELVGRGWIDLLICDMLVVELKAVSTIVKAHRKQTLHYLNAGKYDLGLIMNFHAPRMIDGIARVIR